MVAIFGRIGVHFAHLGVFELVGVSVSYVYNLSVNFGALHGNGLLNLVMFG